MHADERAEFRENGMRCPSYDRWIGRCALMMRNTRKVFDRVPDLGTRGSYLQQHRRDKPIEHKHCIDKPGEYRPDIVDWPWTADPASRGTAIKSSE